MARKRGLPSTLFKSAVNEELRKKLREDYTACLPVMDMTLTLVIKTTIEKSYKKTESEDVYTKPEALAYLADQQGYRRAMKEILNLLGEK